MTFWSALKIQLILIQHIAFLLCLYYCKDAILNSTTGQSYEENALLETADLRLKIQELRVSAR